jgi:hypothetical protein
MSHHQNSEHEEEKTEETDDEQDDENSLLIPQKAKTGSRGCHCAIAVRSGSTSQKVIR